MKMNGKLESSAGLESIAADLECPNRTKTDKNHNLSIRIRLVAIAP